MAQRIPWERFWSDGTDEFYLGDDGFLTDPRSEYLKHNAGLKALEAFEDGPCLILLGEMGIGKSSEIERYDQALQSRGLHCVRFNLGDYDAETLNELFTDKAIVDWRTGSETLHLFLDGFDEAVASMHALTERLCRQIQQWPRDRLRLRIVCRSGIWPATAQEKFRSVLPAVSVLTMAPLRRRDAEEAAGQLGIADPGTFVGDIQKAGATPFAIKPQTLIMLIKKYMQDGRFPESETALYNDYCKLLCTEPMERIDRQRGGKLTADQRVVVAGRIALLMLCGGKSLLYKGGDSGNLRSTELSIDTALRGLELVSDTEGPLMRDDIVEVASGGLFRHAGPHRVTWSHHSYAEHLAAKYAVDRLDLQQVLAVLTDHASGAVVPQLAGLAARLASLSPDIFGALVRANPDQMLYCDGTRLTGEMGGALVAALLEAFHEGRVPYRWNRRERYVVLEHPSLSSQLRAALASADTRVRQEAISIAGACRTTKVRPLLVQIARDGQEPSEIRRAAAESIAAIGGTQSVAVIRELFMDASLNDDLKGFALRYLWQSRSIPAEEVFANLTPRKEPDHFGSYHMALMDLPESLKKCDLPAAYSWVEAQPPQHSLSDVSFQLLADRILARGVDLSSDKSDFRALAKVVKAHLRKNAGLGRPFGVSELFKRLSEDSAKRRDLLEALAAMTSSAEMGDPMRLYSLRSLLRSEDFRWLVDRAECESGAERKEVLANLAGLAWDWSDPDAYEIAYRAHQADSVLQRVFQDAFTIVPLDSELARRGKEMYSAPEPPAPNADDTWPGITADIEALLEKADNGDLSAWWKLNIVLTYDPPRQASEWTQDLRSLPGWARSTDATRKRFLAAARKYIVESNQTGAALERSDKSRPAGTGYRSLLLLHHEEPNLISGLSAQRWAHWTRAILSYPTIDLEQSTAGADRVLIERVLSEAPQMATQALGELLDEPEWRNQIEGLLRRLGDSAPAVDQVLEAALVKYDWPSGPREVLLEHLIARNRESALTLAESMALRPLRNAASVECALIGARVLVRHDCVKYWPRMWARARRNEKFGSALVSELPFDAGDGPLVRKLTEHQLSDVYVWLHRYYPESKYPWPTLGGFDFRSPPYVRYMIPGHLADRGSRQAVMALESIVVRIGRAPILDHHLTEARERLLEVSWRPTEP